MTQVLYDDLWHYSERFSRDKLQRSEFLTMAYMQGLKMGTQCTPSLIQGQPRRYSLHGAMMRVVGLSGLGDRGLQNSPQ